MDRESETGLNAYNAYYERPAPLGLAGCVAGRRGARLRVPVRQR
jgi:hypothetical protein